MMGKRGGSPRFWLGGGGTLLMTATTASLAAATTAPVTLLPKLLVMSLYAIIAMFWKSYNTGI